MITYQNNKYSNPLGSSMETVQEVQLYEWWRQMTGDTGEIRKV